MLMMIIKIVLLAGLAWRSRTPVSLAILWYGASWSGLLTNG